MPNTAQLILNIYISFQKYYLPYCPPTYIYILPDFAYHKRPRNAHLHKADYRWSHSLGQYDEKQKS